jgi:hypothetical protein
METPTCTNQVRRSTRCNTYNGFKPMIVSDAKPVKSKVKPRKVLEVLVKQSADGDTGSTSYL